MRAIWIKICANTSLEDARLAAEFGADAVGFVFAPSKRQVTAEQVAGIVPNLPSGLEKIGVFTAQDAEEIVRVVHATGLTGVQLHGGVDLDLARRLRSSLDGVTIIQTLHWAVGGEATNIERVKSQLRAIGEEPAIDRVLVDSKTGGASGGSGVPFDWSAARKALAASETKLIVAGGLRPENVAEAIAMLEPWGVDVASGVEGSPGVKDRHKLLYFIAEASRADI